MNMKYFVLMLLVVCICCISVPTVFGGWTPVFSEYVTGGSFDNTWSLLVGEGTLTPASSDSAYPPGQVFPNPSGDGWVMKVLTVPVAIGTEGGASGVETWTDMLVSAQMFVNVSLAKRHDTMLGGRYLLTPPLEWGAAGRGGYFTEDQWGITVPCWSIRNNYDAPDPAVTQSYTSNGWHQIILVFSGTKIDMYVDKTYAEVVADLNAPTPAPLLTFTGLYRAAGGVGFYCCYRDSDANQATGEPGYIDDIEVYLPPYTTPTPTPTITPTPTPAGYAEVNASWTIYE